MPIVAAVLEYHVRRTFSQIVPADGIGCAGEAAEGRGVAHVGFWVLGQWRGEGD